MDLAKEEIFGPIVAIYKFKSEEEVIELANRNDYGLGSYFYTNDNSRFGEFLKPYNTAWWRLMVALSPQKLRLLVGLNIRGLVEWSHLGIEGFCQVKALHLSF